MAIEPGHTGANQAARRFHQPPTSANQGARIVVAMGGGDLALRLEQGHAIARPSLLRLRARRTQDGPIITVGGRVVETARGKLL